jgi:glycosyltransferase involved in cell wall biosynthesis
MAGDGPQFETFKKKVEDRNIDDVRFEGYVEGQKKHQVFCDADILFLPSLSEGLPCVIMEAMLYGLPIVTRPIGAIPNWVKQNENGWLSMTTDPTVFAKAIVTLFSQTQLLLSIKNRNTTTALNHFTPVRVKKEMQFIHNQVLNGFSES